MSPAGGGPQIPPPGERRPPPERKGWKLYQWREFGRILAALAAEVEALERADPAGYRSHPSTKRLAAIYRLVTDIIPTKPNAPEFRQGNTMGPVNRHWFSAGFYERYRLFFRFRSDARAIVFVWVNDQDTLRARGGRNDPYAVFERMLKVGRPPADWDDLLKESEGLRIPGEP
jgi:toxin YhaV